MLRECHFPGCHQIVCVLSVPEEIVGDRPNAEILWASPRELLNLFHAENAGCHIITATKNVLDKLPLVGKDLQEYSLETVKMFHNDARSAGYKLVD